MATQSVTYNPYFDDPRLKMTLGGRLCVRAAGWIGYVFLIVTILVLAASPLMWMKAVSALLVFFLIDVFLRRYDADRPLYELPSGGGPVNVARYLTPAAYKVIERAFDSSSLCRRHLHLELLYQLLGVDKVREGLRRLDVPLKDFEAKVEEFLHAEEAKEKVPAEERRAAIERIAVQAFEHAAKNKHEFVRNPDVFSALSSLDDVFVKRAFSIFEIDHGDLERALIFGEGTKRLFAPRRVPKQIGAFLDGSYRPIRHRIMNRAWTARPTPTLDAVSTDLTDLARHGDIGFLIGHESEYERLVNTLSRSVNPNVLLVGEAGIGKEAIVAHLALELSKDEVPPSLFDKRLVEMHLSGLVAGAAPEELHKRLQKIVEEILLAGNVILYIPDIHDLVHTSGTAYLSAADALMPIIMNNAFPIVGASYPKEFKQDVEPRSDFVGVFEVIHVQEITVDDAEKLLVYMAMVLEREFNVLVSFGAVKQAVRLAKKYVRNKFLPSSAEELLKDALVEAQKRGEDFVGTDAITQAAERKVAIPIHEATKAEAEKLLNLEAVIHERYVNQDEAVKAVANALREYRSGLSRKGGPIATFLFLGPTGVGKTELAKAVAQIQFGSEKLMLRFDMSEFQNKESLYRMIGSPDGGTRGALTDAVLERPYAVVLLDEFEKSHPDILNVFLQVFDDGRLTDNFNRVVDFQNTVIIATSNAHADIMIEALRHGETMEQIAEYVKTRLVDVFKPELLNRFTRIVVFRDLSPEHMALVAELNLREVARALEDQGIAIEFSPEVVERVARLGYDPSFGARPIRRVIEEKIRAPLAEKILKKEMARGSRVRAVLEADEMKFTVGE